jgi:hypothetical protein
MFKIFCDKRDMLDKLNISVILAGHTFKSIVAVPQRLTAQAKKSLPPPVSIMLIPMLCILKCSVQKLFVL